MSRAATATPPQPYFPQRNSTPSMKHASSPNVSAAHFPTANRHQSSAPKRKTKNLPSSLVGALSRKSSKAEVQTVDALGLSFEDISSSAASASPSPPQSDKGQDTLMSEPGSYKHGEDVDPHGGRVTPAPSMTTSCSASFVATPLPTPSSSRAPSFLQPDPVVQDPASPTSPTTNSAPRASWAPYFGKVAKAVVNTGMSMGIAFGEKRNKKDVPLVEPPVVQSAAASVDPSLARDAIYVPTAGTPRLTMEDLAHLDAEAAMEKRREWAMEQRRRITECARLCSQWPHSGYNQSKWGPTGSKHFYEPQSYSNPAHVATIMHKQAELERLITTNSATFFSCRHRRRGSSAESSTDPSVASYESSRSSPAHSISLLADLSAAMASPLIGDNEVTSDTPHVTSSAINASPKFIKGVRSVSELDKLAECMALDSYGMDVDVEPLPQFAKSPTGLSATGTRPARAQSCGAKRPAACGVEEEDKRRKVDEAMVVEEAVATGVIQPGSGHRSLPCSGDKAMSASTPNLGTPGSAANSGNPAMFGHVVKTSDTHPIIISPFFPDELLPTISEQMVVPSSIYQMYSTADASERPSSFILGSKIDVPSLLLSFIPPQMNPNAPLAVSPAPHNRIESDRPRIGNLLLSSCPGKRLRMEGPVKGRGPICRDLATDLRRIKNEGVGCLVCCLDDTELALLGVPWETYLEVAAGTGLDVIRMPMPDGLTPVSLALFDSQVSLIATKYSLQGINVLVHCRGGVGRAGLTASAWAIKMGFVPPHPSLAIVEEAAVRQHDEQQSRSGQSHDAVQLPAELEHQIVMSMVERVIAMIRSRRGLKAIESFEQVQFLVSYIKWIRANTAQATAQATA